MSNFLQKHTGFRQGIKVLAFSLFLAVVGTVLLLVFSYPKMKSFKKSWLALDCVWGDKEFKSQYVGKMHVWRTPGGTYPCSEEKGYVKCLVLDREDFYAGKRVHVSVYTLFKDTKGKVGLTVLTKVDGIDEKYYPGYCSQLDAVYDKDFGGCIKRVGYCTVGEVEF